MLLTLITVPVAFLLVVLRSLSTILRDDVTLVLDVTVVGEGVGSAGPGTTVRRTLVG